MVSQSGLPVQRACQAAGLSRATYYRPVVNWAQRDGPVIEALTTLGATKPRWGVLEICGSAAEHWTSVESQAVVARLLSVTAESAVADGV